MFLYPVAASIYFVSVIRRRVVEADTIEQAAFASVSGYFSVLGLASTPALFGHSLVYIGGGTAAAVAGTAVTYVLLWLVASSRSSLLWLERRLAEDGRASSLTDQLMKPQPAVG
jgi:hypothetical protein